MWPDDENVRRLADLAGLDAGQVVAQVRAERAEPGPMRDLWASIAVRLARTAVAGLAAVCTVGGGPDAGAQNPAPSARLMIMSNCQRTGRRRLKRLFGQVGAISQGPVLALGLA